VLLQLMSRLMPCHLAATHQAVVAKLQDEIEFVDQRKTPVGGA